MKRAIQAIRKQVQMLDGTIEEQQQRLADLSSEASLL